MFKTIVLIFIPFLLVAQAPQWPKSYFSAGYYGNLVTNPGIAFDYHLKLAENIKTKTIIKRNREAVKYKTHQLEFNPQMGYFIDPKSFSALFLNASIGYKHIKNKGWFLNPALGVGTYTLFTRNNYSFQANEASFIGTKSTTFLCPVAKLSIGKLNRKTKNGIYANTNVLFPINYNNGILPLPAIEIGTYF